MKPSFTFLLPTTICILLTSCAGGSRSEGEQAAAEAAADQRISHDLEELMKDLPNPSLVPFTLKSVGAAYDGDLVHDLESAAEYRNTYDKVALNLGIYASDVSYLAAYGKEEDCIKYLNTCHNLAASLGDSVVFTKRDIDAFAGHIKDQNQIEISKILSQLFVETSVRLKEEHHLTLAGLAHTGSFVEGLYQAVMVIESYENTPENGELLAPLIQIVLDEEKALVDVIQLLEDLPFNDTLAEMIIELSILDRLYKSDLSEINENLNNDPDYILQRRAIRDIAYEVKRIRQKITQPL